MLPALSLTNVAGDPPTTRHFENEDGTLTGVTSLWHLAKHHYAWCYLLEDGTVGGAHVWVDGTVWRIAGAR